jgi:hypothetical protein
MITIRFYLQTFCVFYCNYYQLLPTQIFSFKILIKLKIRQNITNVNSIV